MAAGSGCLCIVPETSFLVSWWKEGANVASVQAMGVSPSCEHCGAGAWHGMVHAHPSWLPRHVMLGVALSRLGILVFHAHESGHLGKAFAKSPAAKTLSQAAHPTSLQAHVFRTRACAGTRLSHHTARSWAPGILKESEWGSGFHIFRCRLIFIQRLRFG